ncbi:MAG: polyprenyl synthetase family protein [Deltaproteobacteria bacterium]|nr:polyprenyl synthetase family protein [Deltaproteobacteria bacterium]
MFHAFHGAADVIGTGLLSTASIENEISALCASLSGPAGLMDAVRYALSGGKRIRPVLSLSVCEDLGGNSSDLLPAAIALEVLHAASLVHDDLPGLDNDDMRRGQPSCHKKFGEATAILAGDYMISLAFRAVQRSSCSTQIKLTMQEVLSDAFADLCCGQQLDLAPPEFRGDIRRLHELKTGALFSASAAFGALVADLPKEGISCAGQLGKSIGLAFQVVDDYLDVFGSDAVRGRKESSDIRNNKPTFFNSADKQTGLAFLRSTQKEIDHLVGALGAFATTGTPAMQRTRDVVGSIFDRLPPA